MAAVPKNTGDGSGGTEAVNPGSFSRHGSYHSCRSHCGTPAVFVTRIGGGSGGISSTSGRSRDTCSSGSFTEAASDSVLGSVESGGNDVSQRSHTIVAPSNVAIAGSIFGNGIHGNFMCGR